MKIVIAIDSFKGSMSSIEAGIAAKEGFFRAMPDAGIVVKPLADGGEGTTDALIEGLSGERMEVAVAGPYWDNVIAHYGIIKADKAGAPDMAVMEMAEAAGITISEKREPMSATTYGVGEMITDALDHGCRDFIIGIGGSATNDGGIGMLSSLGVKFTDGDGEALGEGGADLSRIANIDISGLDERLRDCRIRVACDVDNPLCGENGATYIYGPQKGVTDEIKEDLDKAMAHYADATARVLGKDLRETHGAGAAGGLGFALIAYLGAELIPGIELIMEAVGLEKEMEEADLVVTGEGRLDFQTSMGKAPVGVARLAKRYDASVIAFAGSVTEEARACNEAGIDAFFPIVRGVTTLSEAMDKATAKANMTAAAEQAARLIKSVIKKS